MKKRQWYGIVVAVTLLAFTFSCTPMVKPFADWSPKQKAVYFMKVYNAQYNDTMLMANMANATEAQKKVVRAKKEVLSRIYPLMIVYVGTVNTGGVPSSGAETQLLALINELTNIGG